mgnify:FL=1|tara:strand:- start:184 stop:423 length:240 start_codon:yes stop_codon:yes gene_type:complete
MKDEPITVEDYKLVSDEFFQKYNFVADRLGVTKKAEDILKVMEALSSAVMKDRVKEKVGPFGFNKNGQDSNREEKGEAE